jgi:hypothetical protein
MKSNTTAIWFVLAVALAACIWIFQHHFQPAAPVVAGLLPGLRPDRVTDVQVIPNGSREISVVRTNSAWLLQKPVAYPAQAAAIETLLAVLEKLTPVTRLTAEELRGRKNADAEFGFENKQFSLVVEAGDQRWQLLVGKPTAPGDQVFVRVVGMDDVFVTDTAWLQYLPHSGNDWRDTALVDAAGACDSIIITNGAKVIELRCDPTNHLWRMTRPLPARADGERIAAALQQLRSARVQFVSDDPKADLTAFGLQPAELDVWLGSGTNFLAAVHAGKNPPENPALIYARREGWNSVLTVAKDAVAPWRGAVNDFRDAHLLTLTAPVAEIEVRGENNNNFTLRRSGTNAWTLAGEKFSADPENVQVLLRLLAGFRASEFVKDRNTMVDLQGFGLGTPSRQITLRTVAGDTNSVLVQLQFGTAGTNQVFVKRADEDYVYALPLDDFKSMPVNGWTFRDRRIWNFSTNDVTQLTIRQNGKTRQIVRDAAGKWSLAPGSQGVLDARWMETIVSQFGDMTAAGWIARNFTEPEKFGFTPQGLQITIELKDGRKFTVDFGPEVQAQAGLAAVTLDGERWAFVCPTSLYQFALLYLNIPPNTP